MPSSTSNSDFERIVPALPWRGLLLSTLVLTALATFGWEIQARAWGYAPCLNDTPDLWADWRERVQPDSIVIIGDSRAIFDMDLNELEQGLGKRPIQLAMPGSCAYPVLEDLANDLTFHGTVLCSIVPGMWMAPPPAPPYQNGLEGLKRMRNRTMAHRSGHHLGMFLEEHLAFMKNEDLILSKLLEKVSVPNRANSYLPPDLPPYFQSIDRDRRTWMSESCEKPGPLQDRVKFGWLPLFTPPPFPDYTPKEVLAGMAAMVEARYGQTTDAVRRIQGRGGQVVFIRFPHSGKLKELEDAGTPRSGIWTRLMNETGAPNIYYSDHPELVYECPEWSHLSASQSIEFTHRLVPYLKTALQR